MRVAVIGAGIVGVTTAWELATAGHEVTVYERHDSVAAEASFATAGVIAPGAALPWASPGSLRALLRLLGARGSGLRVRNGIDPTMLPWLWRAWRSSTPSHFEQHRGSLLRLARYSRERLADLQRSLHLDYERAEGRLVLLRTQRDLAGARAGLSMLAETGVKFALVDARRCREIEPSLNAEAPLHAGVHIPDDEVGNCRQFAHLLRQHAQAAGANFRFDCAIDKVVPGARPAVEHGAATDIFDAVALCTGVDGARLLRPHGLKPPLRPVWGYSITLPLRHHEAYPDVGPRAGLLDQRFQVSIARLGQRVRVAGVVEVGGEPGQIDDSSVNRLYRVLDDWFPGSVARSHVRPWKGARPTLPDGLPLIGASGLPGIWLNLGHGAHGWALSFGAAHRLAAAIAGVGGATGLEAFGPARLR